MNRGTWQTIAHRVTKSQTRLKQLSSSSSRLLNMNNEFFLCCLKFHPTTHAIFKGIPLVGQTVKCLSAKQETRVQSLGWEDPLEKEMAAHSSILAWRIPWTEESVELQFTGSQRVGHN